MGCLGIHQNLQLARRARGGKEEKMVVTVRTEIAPPTLTANKGDTKGAQHRTREKGVAPKRGGVESDSGGSDAFERQTQGRPSSTRLQNSTPGTRLYRCRSHHTHDDTLTVPIVNGKMVTGT